MNSRWMLPGSNKSNFFLGVYIAFLPHSSELNKRKRGDLKVLKSTGEGVNFNAKSFEKSYVERCKSRDLVKTDCL